MIDYHELDMMVVTLEQEIKDLKYRIEQLESENAILREQSRNLERQVYNGPTM